LQGVGVINALHQVLAELHALQGASIPYEPWIRVDKGS
jgi:hypothetical protein